MQKIVFNLVAVAAVAGWVAAFLGMSESGDLEDRLTAAKVELSKVSEQLTDTQSRLALMQGAASSLEDIDTQVVEKQTEATALAGEIAAKKSELGALRQDFDAGEMELAALGDRVTASKAVLSGLTRDREAAKAELDRLRAESERQLEAAIGSPMETPSAVPAPEAPPAPVAAPATAEAVSKADLIER